MTSISHFLPETKRMDHYKTDDYKMVPTKEKQIIPFI